MSDDRPMHGSADERIAAGRDALRRHVWHEAFEKLHAADADAQLAPEDLERLAEVAEWIGRFDTAIEVRERAHASQAECGNLRRAGFLALQLAHNHFARNQAALATGCSDVLSIFSCLKRAASTRFLICVTAALVIVVVLSEPAFSQAATAGDVSRAPTGPTS